MIPWKTSGRLMQQREAQVPPGSCLLFRCVVASPGTPMCCLKGAVGLGSAEPCCFKGNVTYCIFKKQMWCLLVGGFQPLLRTEQDTKGVLKMERRHHSLLFLLTSLPACLAYPAELCRVLWISRRLSGTEGDMVVCRANASKCHCLE